MGTVGPVSDAARPLMPSMIDWLDHNGRIAVQAFLVISGFLVAKSLSPAGLPGADWWVCGPATAKAEDAEVDLDEVQNLYTEHGLWKHGVLLTAERDAERAGHPE